VVDRSGPVDRATADSLAQPCALSLAGFTKEAGDSLRTALAKQPALRVPVDFGPYEKADALLHAGYVEEASAEVKRQVASNPGADIPRDLLQLLPNRVNAWARWRERTTPWLLDVGQILATVVVALLGLYAVSLVFKASIGRSQTLRRFWLKHPVLVIDPPSSGGQDTTVDPLHDRLAARFREEFQTISTDAGGHDMRIVNSPAGAVASAPQLGELSSNLKFVDSVIAFLQRVAPPFQVHLAFVCHPPDARGVALSVMLTGHTGRILETTVLRENTFNPDCGPGDTSDDLGRYEVLAIAAAAWAFYGLAKGLPEKAPFGTASWRSYALFKVGVLWLQNNKADRARRLFSDALVADDRNIGARINAAFLDASAPTVTTRMVRKIEVVEREVRARAERRHQVLQFARPRFDERESMRWDPLWFRPAYVRAGVLVNRYYQGERQDGLPPAPVPEQTISVATELAWAIETTLLDLESHTRAWTVHRFKVRAQRRQDDTLRTLLTSLEPYALLALAVVLTRSAPDIAFEGPDAKLTRRELAARLNPMGRTVSHRDLANFERPWERLDRIEAVNLAGYLSELGSLNWAAHQQAEARRFWEEAFDQLELALRLEPAAVVADPTLDGLKTYSAASSQLRNTERALAITGAPERRRELKDHLGMVGAGSSSRLLRHGVQDKRDLVIRAATPTGRTALANTTGIPERTILRWVRLAELFDRIEMDPTQRPIDPGYGVLFEHVPVEDVADFLNRQDLVPRLCALNARMSAVADDPTPELIEAWRSRLDGVASRITV
jgi:hypothetical protein